MRAILTVGPRAAAGKIGGETAQDARDRTSPGVVLLLPWPKLGRGDGSAEICR
jgi:hypothetical protein